MTAEALTIESLRRWTRAGAHWRLLHRSEGRAVVELQQCTGEPVERLQSEDPALIAYLKGIESDLDLTDDERETGMGTAEASELAGPARPRAAGGEGAGR